MFINSERFPKKDSIWCNPYKVGKDGTLEEVLVKYRRHINRKVRQEGLWDEFEDLDGKNLGCWCVSGFNVTEKTPCVCHGQVLLDLLDNYFSSSA